MQLHTHHAAVHKVVTNIMIENNGSQASSYMKCSLNEEYSIVRLPIIIYKTQNVSSDPLGLQKSSINA